MPLSPKITKHCESHWKGRPLVLSWNSSCLGRSTSSIPSHMHSLKAFHSSSINKGHCCRINKGCTCLSCIIPEARCVINRTSREHQKEQPLLLGPSLDFTHTPWQVSLVSHFQVKVLPVKLQGSSTPSESKTGFSCSTVWRLQMCAMKPMHSHRCTSFEWMHTLWSQL